MRKFLMVTASLASLGLIVQSAQAADVIPEPVPVATWTGLHIGLGGGAGYNTYDASSNSTLSITGEDEDGPFTFPLLSNSIDGDDLGAWYGFGTAEIGFDYQFQDSPIVLGVLANYDFNGSNDAKASSDSSILPGGLPGEFSTALASLNNSVQAELEDSWFLGGRLGFVMNENTLLYGLGGYTWVKGKVRSDHALDIVDGPDTMEEIGGTHVSDKGSVDGWTIGAGLEHLITPNLSLKVEYRHDFLDSLNAGSSETLLTNQDNGDTIDLTNDTKVDFSRDTVRAVLSWRFNPFAE